MKRRSSTTVLILGVASLLAAGGTLTAWANWTTGATSARVTAEADRIPTMGAPRAKVTAAGDAQISWKAVSAIPVDGYVVTRLRESTGTVVCTVPATATSCVDKTLPPGSTVSYVVRATLGPQWTGANSKPSDSITTAAAAAPDKAVPKVTTPAAEPGSVEAAQPKPAAPPPAPAESKPEEKKQKLETEKKDASDPPASGTTEPDAPAATATSPEAAPSISE